MRKSRFSEEQKVKMLREAERSSVAAVAKKHGVSEYHKYRKQSSTSDGYNNVSIEQNCANPREHQDEPLLESGVDSALFNSSRSPILK